MDWLEILSYDWAVRALIASAMVGVLCGSLGCFIVLRNMAMIGDALSHAILPGVVFAFLIVGGYSTLGFFVGSVIAGLLTAVLITWLQHNVQTKNDAAIGIIFTAMFAIGVIGISGISRTGVHLDLKDFLFGNVLGIADSDLILTGCVTVVVILSIIIFYRQLFITTFQPTIADTIGISTSMVHYFLMLLLSFAVVASLRTVGVILVVAMLITPASTAILWSNRLHRVIAIAALAGLVAAVGGFFAAVYFETTPGPAMAVASTFIYGISVFAAPEKGIVSKYLQRRKLQARIRQEDFLKRAIKIDQGRRVPLDQIASKLDFHASRVRRLAKKLKNRKLLQFQNGSEITLTPKGREKANALVRAHRLWETYLVNEIGLNEMQIHEDAERLEHLLTDDILDEVEEKLGYPRIDPHGSPIPGKQGYPRKSLDQLEKGTEASIAAQQPEEVVAKLWEMGILPGQAFEVLKTTDESVTLSINGKDRDISRELARKVAVVSLRA